MKCFITTSLSVSANRFIRGLASCWLITACERRRQMALVVIVCPHNESAYHQMGWQSMLQYFILLYITQGYLYTWCSYSLGHPSLFWLQLNLRILNVSIGTDKIKSHNLESLELRIVTGGRVFLGLDQLKTSIL